MLSTATPQHRTPQLRNTAPPYPTLPYPTLPYPTLPYPALPYPTPYPALPYPSYPSSDVSRVIGASTLSGVSGVKYLNITPSSKYYSIIEVLLPHQHIITVSECYYIIDILPHHRRTSSPSVLLY